MVTADTEEGPCSVHSLPLQMLLLDSVEGKSANEIIDQISRSMFEAGLDPATIAVCNAVSDQDVSLQKAINDACKKGKRTTESEFKISRLFMHGPCFVDCGETLFL